MSRRATTHLHHWRDCQAESQSDLNDCRRVHLPERRVRCGVIQPHDAAAADEQQHGRAQELGERHPPQFVVVRHVVHRDHTMHHWKRIPITNSCYDKKPIFQKNFKKFSGLIFNWWFSYRQSTGINMPTDFVRTWINILYNVIWSLKYKRIVNRTMDVLAFFRKIKIKLLRTSHRLQWQKQIEF